MVDLGTGKSIPAEVLGIAVALVLAAFVLVAFVTRPRRGRAMVGHQEDQPRQLQDEPPVALWALSLAALAMLALAGLNLLPGVPSPNCIPRDEIGAWPALPLFLAYVAAGGCVTWLGSRRQQLALFTCSSLILVFYGVGLWRDISWTIHESVICAKLTRNFDF